MHLRVLLIIILLRLIIALMMMHLLRVEVKLSSIMSLKVLLLLLRVEVLLSMMMLMILVRLSLFRSAKSRYAAHIMLELHSLMIHLLLVYSFLEAFLLFVSLINLETLCLIYISHLLMLSLDLLL